MNIQRVAELPFFPHVYFSLTIYQYLNAKGSYSFLLSYPKVMVRACKQKLYFSVKTAVILQKSVSLTSISDMQAWFLMKFAESSHKTCSYCYSSILEVLCFCGVHSFVRLFHSRLHNISVAPWGNFRISNTRVNLDSRLTYRFWWWKDDVNYGSGNVEAVILVYFVK